MKENNICSNTIFENNDDLDAILGVLRRKFLDLDMNFYDKKLDSIIFYEKFLIGNLNIIGKPLSTLKFKDEFDEIVKENFYDDLILLSSEKSDNFICLKNDNIFSVTVSVS